MLVVFLIFCMVVGDFVCLNCKDESCTFMWFVCILLGFHLFVGWCFVLFLLIIVCFVLCIVRFVVYLVIVGVIGWGRVCVMFFSCWDVCGGYGMAIGMYFLIEWSSWCLFGVVYLDIFGLWFFYFWYLFCVSCVIRRVMGRVGVLFSSFLGMGCDLYFLVVGLDFRLCVKLSLYFSLWRGR